MDTVASFTCNDAYNLFGFETNTCQTDGTWNQSTPLCADIGNEMSTLYLVPEKFYVGEYTINICSFKIITTIINYEDLSLVNNQINYIKLPVTKFLSI